MRGQECSQQLSGQAAFRDALCLAAGKPTTHWAVLAKAWSVGEGKWIFLSLLPSETTLGVLGGV